MLLLVITYGSKVFLDYLSDVAVGALASTLVYEMLAYQLIEMLPVLLPTCLYFAVLIVFSRMLQDRELTVMLASGLGPSFFLRTVFLFALVFALLVAVIAFYAGPWATAQSLRLTEQAKQESDITGIASGRFKEFSTGHGVVYVDQVSPDNGVMRDVFLQLRDRDKFGLLTAKEAHLETDESTGDRYVVFEDGRRYEGTPGQLNYKVTDYQRYAVLIESRRSADNDLGVGAIPTSKLWLADESQYAAELQLRISNVLACLLLPLLAVLLARMTFGHRQYLVYLSAIPIFFLYLNLLEISAALLRRGELLRYIGLWWVHGTLIIVIAILFYLPLLQRWRKGGSMERIVVSKA